MNSNSLSGTVWGCAALAAVLLVLATAIWTLEAVGKLIESGFFLQILALCLALAVTSVPLALGIDLLRSRWSAFRTRRELAASIRNSPFPRHEHLERRELLDSVIWRLIDSDLGRQTVRLRRGRGSSQNRNRRIAAVSELRDLLLQDEGLFRKWSAAHLPRILRDPHHQPALNGVYNEIMRRVRTEAAYRPTELLATVGYTIVQDPGPAPRWLVTQAVLRFLTWGKVFAPVATDENLARLDTRQGRTRKLHFYLSDSRRFRRFMAQHFFEIMGELCPLQFDLPNVHRDYEAEKKDDEHYSEVPVRTLLSKYASAEGGGEGQGTRDEARRRRRQRREELERLRQAYLPTLRKGVFFRLFGEGRSGVDEAIYDVVITQCHGDDDQAQETLRELQADKRAFLRFWKQYELDVLEAHDERIAAQAIVIPEEERTRWQEQTAARAVAIHRSERERLKTDGYVALDLDSGSLLATARQQVHRKLPDAEHGALENYLERELRRLLTADGAEGQYFGDAVRQALVECEAFRQGDLYYREQIRQLGYQADTDRDRLALAFVENAAKWRQRFEPTASSPQPAGAKQKQTQEKEKGRSAKRTPEPEPRSTPTPEPALADGLEQSNVIAAAHLEIPENAQDDLLLTTKQAAQYLNLTPRALEGYRYKGGGPLHVNLSARAVRYQLGDLKTWVSDRIRSSTSDPGSTPERTEHQPRV